MDQNEPHRDHAAAAPPSYTRLTTLEIDGPHAGPTAHAIVVDRDRALMAAFSAISLALILTATLFPITGPDGPGPSSGPRFTLHSLSISDFRATPAQISGSCDVRLNVTNPGETSLRHENAVVTVYLGHELLWVARSGGFVLRPGETAAFSVRTGVESVAVPDAFVPTEMVEGRELGRTMRFKVKYDGMVREGGMEEDTWREERAHVYVVCGWVQMGFVNDSVAAGGPANCAFEIF